MEPVSFALAVVGIFGTCVKGYTIISDTYNAPNDAQDAARRLRIERAVLHGWGEQFGVLTFQPEDNERLIAFLGQGHTFDGVFDALCGISETFIDVRRMERKYGLTFEYRRERGEVLRTPPEALFYLQLTYTQRRDILRDMDDFLAGRDLSPPRALARGGDVYSNALDKIKRCQAKMSLLERCNWSLSGKSRVKALIGDLREFNDDLLRLCTYVQRDQISRGIPHIALSQSENYVALHSIAYAAEDSVEEDSKSPSIEARKKIAEMVSGFDELLFQDFKLLQLSSR